MKVPSSSKLEKITTLNDFFRWTSEKNKNWTPINPMSDENFDTLVQDFPEVVFKETRQEMLKIFIGNSILIVIAEVHWQLS